MKQFTLDISRFKDLRLRGIITIFFVITALFVLAYVLIHNPHQKLHQQIFKTADTVRNYYRDHPGYWGLSTESAANDNLIASGLNNSEYELKIGQGIEGDAGTPGDPKFDITLKKLNKVACIHLSEAKISKKHQLILQKISIINDRGIVEFTWGGIHKLPLKKYASRKICQANDNTVMWTFQ